MTNSKRKGARGEREWRDRLRAAGFLKSRRSQQYSGVGDDSSDVQCPELPKVWFEVKRVQRLNVREAFMQARLDAKGNRVPVVAHKANYGPWLVTMSAEDFFELVNHSDWVGG